MLFTDDLVEVLKLDFKVGNVPAVMGEPGIGKSSLMHAVAYATGTKCFVLNCGILADKADLTGARPVRDEATGEWKMTFFPHEDILAAIQYAEDNPRETPILFMDEINRSNSDVTSASLGISTERRVGNRPLPKNLRIAVAGNLKGNVNALDDASLSRFSVYTIEPDGAQVVAHHGDDLNHWIKTALIKNPEMVFAKSTPNGIAADGPDDADATAVADIFASEDEPRQLTTPRTIKYLSDWLNAVDTDALRRYMAIPVTLGTREVTMLNEIIEAKIGNTPLAAQVVAAIVDDLANVSATTTSNQIVVPRPGCYDDLVGAGTVDELEALIAGMTDSEKSGSLLFALQEGRNNARLISELALRTTSFEQAHVTTLVELLRAQQTDTENVQAFLAATGPIVDDLRLTIQAFV